MSDNNVYIFAYETDFEATTITCESLGFDYRMTFNMEYMLGYCYRLSLNGGNFKMNGITTS